LYSDYKYEQSECKQDEPPLRKGEIIANFYCRVTSDEQLANTKR